MTTDNSSDAERQEQEAISSYNAENKVRRKYSRRGMIKTGVYIFAAISGIGVLGKLENGLTNRLAQYNTPIVQEISDTEANLHELCTIKNKYPFVYSSILAPKAAELSTRLEHEKANPEYKTFMQEKSKSDNYSFLGLIGFLSLAALGALAVKRSNLKDKEKRTAEIKAIRKKS